MRAYNRKRRLKDIDKVREDNRKWWAENKEAISARRRVLRQNRTLEQIRREKIRVAQWKNDNRERHYANNRKWAEGNPEAYQASRLTRKARRRMREREAKVEPVSRTVVFRASGGRCFYCLSDINKQVFHVDHVIPLSAGGGHSYDNVVASCASCNLRKSNQVNGWYAGCAVKCG